MAWIVALWLLVMYVAVHAICDYPLQGDFLAKAKNRATPIPGVPFWQALGAHVAIHAGGVLVTTFWGLLVIQMAVGNVAWDTMFALSLFCSLIEALAHALTDDAKCTGKIGFNSDQAIHLTCKLFYVAACMWALT
jgi:hypothetical protein